MTMSSTTVSRRDALRMGATATAMTAASYSRVYGANEQVQLGVIGMGGRGMYVMETFQKSERSQVRAVCDVYAERIDKALSKAPGAKSFGAHEDLIAMKGLDAVLIATPDHWHAGTAIDALNAKLDVYVEKPLTLRIDEGPKIVKAARVNERVCQVGMQQRSGSHYLRAKDEYIKSGKIGQVTMVRTWWNGNGAHLQRAPERMKEQPSNLNWARFLGPVKWRDWDPQQFWNFRAYLDFGGGQVTDLFTHWIDVAHMFLEKDNPVSAVAAGGIYFAKDGRTAPDTINVLLEYPDNWMATFESTLAPGITGYGVEFGGTEGRLLIDRQKFVWTPKGRGAVPVEVKSEREQTIEHVANFLDCVKSRKRPNGDVWHGHRSAQASHLGNIAYVEKRRLKFDPEREEILPL